MVKTMSFRPAVAWVVRTNLSVCIVRASFARRFLGEAQLYISGSYMYVHSAGRYCIAALPITRQTRRVL